MSVILVLVGFSVVVAVGFLLAFFWSVSTGQYDDTYSSSVRILFDDEKPAESPSQTALTPGNSVEQSPNQK